MVRSLGKGLVALLLLGSSSLAHAQDPALTGDTATPSPKAPIIFESLVGYGGVGFRGGVPNFTGDSDVTKDNSPRLSGDLMFAYVWDDNLVADLDIGYAWNRLGDDTDRWMISSVPMTLGARYFILNHQRRNRPFFGAGGGAYIWTIQSKDLGASKDPITFERLRRASLGYYLTGGVERRMSKWVKASADITYHNIMSKDTTDFPSGFNGNKSYIQARLGITFFFSLSERLDQGLPE
jgi:outer membrane protein W